MRIFKCQMWLCIIMSLSAIMVLQGCKKDKKKKDRFEYYFKFSSDKVPVGAMLMLGDKELGKVNAPSPYGHHETKTVSYVHMAFSPDEFFAGKEGDLSLKLDTPCGVDKIPVEVLDTFINDREPFSEDYEKRSRDTHSYTVVPIKLKLGDKKMPEPTELWIDRDKEDKRELTVGTFTLPPNKSLTMYSMDCAEKHEVKVAGAVIGEIDTTKKRQKGFLISMNPGLCYKSSGISYSSYAQPGMGSSKTTLQKSQIYPLHFSKIDYFLRSAPSSVSGSGSAYMREVVRTPCSDPKGKK